MTNISFDQCLTMATAFLANKKRTNYYETKAICEPYPDNVTTLAELSDEEDLKIRDLKNHYGQDFLNHRD